MKLRERINHFLEGSRGHFSCFFPGNSGFSSSILKLFFSGVKVGRRQSSTIEEIPPNAIIVYVTKHKSKFDYLFYHTRYKLYGLPYPEIGFDYKIVLWQPVGRIFKILIANLDFFFKNMAWPDPYNSGYIKNELLNGRTGFLSIVEKKGFYLRFVKAKTDPVQYLIEMQKSIDRPIYIVPQLMFFGKAPHRSQPTLKDIFFGPEDKPGRIRRLATLFKTPGKVFVETSEPINLMHFLENPENRDQNIEHLSLSLRRNLLVQFNRHRRSITGPVLKSSEELKESILTNERFQQFMTSHSKSRHIPLREVRKNADEYLDEIAAKYSPGLIKIAEVLVGWFLRMMFEDVMVNADDLARVKTMSQKGPLILIPNHKSHIDYLILSYLLYQHNMPCPHIAAGKNLSFWPMGPLFRGGGAFFIRRTFRGAVLYSKVFSEYIFKLLQEGFNIEFFIEGGRSRTGKLIMPKLGLLSILLDAYKNKSCEDMIFAPIYIGYDRVIEETAYLDELEGGQKEKENFLQVIKARKFLKNRYGKIYIQFSDPISINDLLAQHGSSLADMQSKEKNAFCRNLGHRIINSINKSTVVTSYGLVASAILNCPAKKFSYEALKSNVETYIKYLYAQDARLADTLVQDHGHAVRYALEAYVQSKFIEPIPKEKESRHLETEYVINESKRPGLEYYKNNCISFFIPAAFTAIEILKMDAFQFSATDLHSGYAFLQEFFKNEFAYDINLTPDYFVRKSIKTFIDDAVLVPHQTLPDTYNLTSTGFRKLKLYSNFLKTYFESYLIVFNFLMQNPKNAKNTKERLKKIEASGNRMYKRKEIERREALSKVTYQNAIDFFITHGVKGSDDNEKIDYYADILQKYMNHL
ncbi:MAG: 1-acyl-sn-glycerol-3-phosphate acyltransferase [Deltaproteobacteria bacterium]|nr:1-acyl-sn-glycerol-3-phosphate acyltransferase [Deltaproteobacteria bacterium]